MEQNSCLQSDDYKQFSNWLDKILEQEIPEGIVAFNLNLYEGAKGTYDIQLIGAEEFDEDDEDWACTDYFTTGEDVYCLKRTKDIEHWEKGLNYITQLAEQYLNEGRNAHILKAVNAIGIGFVDGDVNIIHRA